MSSLLRVSMAMLLIAAALAAGCAVCPPQQPKPAAPCVCDATGEMATTSMYLPTGQKNSSALRVEKSAPAMVRVGETFDYTLSVTNITKAPLMDVMVRDTVPANFNVVSSSPKAAMKDGALVWELESLGAGQSRTMTVRGSAKSPAVLKPCADVTYRPAAVCLAINVVEPKLTLSRYAPAEMLICDAMDVRMVVKNSGSGTACNVMVRERLPSGLVTMDNKNELVMNAGHLAAGQSREFTTKLRAMREGTYRAMAMATADAGLQAESNETTTVVHKPVLLVSKSAPDTRYIGRPIEYTITVTNGGKLPSEKTMLTDPIPPGAQFVKASAGGVFRDNKVTWDMGTMAPGASRTVTVTLKGTARGVIQNTAMVTAVCGGAQVSSATRVMGIPAILLEVVDVDDPVEVGSTTTYVITVTNQGSAVDTNVRIECEMPPEQSFVSATGPTKEAVVGQKVTFAPLGSLQPQAKAVYKVVVKGEKPGDTRFRVALNSDQMVSPAEETESTRVYQ